MSAVEIGRGVVVSVSAHQRAVTQFAFEDTRGPALFELETRRLTSSSSMQFRLYLKALKSEHAAQNFRMRALFGNRFRN